MYSNITFETNIFERKFILIFGKKGSSFLMEIYFLKIAVLMNQAEYI